VERYKRRGGEDDEARYDVCREVLGGGRGHEEASTSQTGGTVRRLHTRYVKAVVNRAFLQFYHVTL